MSFAIYKTLETNKIPRLNRLTDVGNDKRKQKLVWKDQELIEMKDIIRDLQQARDTDKIQD